jgi:hypothetical protein
MVGVGGLVRSWRGEAARRGRMLLGRGLGGRWGRSVLFISPLRPFYRVNYGRLRNPHKIIKATYLSFLIRHYQGL